MLSVLCATTLIIESLHAIRLTPWQYLTLMLPGPNISVLKQISDQEIQLEWLKCFVIDA